MSFTIAPAAQLELIEAAAWYDDIRLGLGTEFLDAIQHAFARVAAEPRLYATLEYSTASRREVRRYCLRRFPYVIVCWIEGDSVTVVAVSHARQSGHRTCQYHARQPATSGSQRRLAAATIDDRNLDGWWTRVYVSGTPVNDRRQETLEVDGVAASEVHRSQGRQDLCRRLELLVGPEARFELVARDGKVTGRVQSLVQRHS